MTKPLGLPKSKVREPWNDRHPFSKKAERDSFKHRKKTARQLGKRETLFECDDEVHVFIGKSRKCSCGKGRL